MREKELVISKKWNNPVWILLLKETRLFFIYNMLRGGVPESNGTWGKKVTSGNYIWSEG